MSVTKKNLLLIVPIFIIMSLFIGSLKYITSKNEMNQFLEEEIKAFIVGIHQFFKTKDAITIIKKRELNLFYEKAFQSIKNQNKITKAFVMYWNDPNSIFSLIGDASLIDLQIKAENYNKIIHSKDAFYLSEIYLEENVDSTYKKSNLEIFYDNILNYLNINQDKYTYHRYAYSILYKDYKYKQDILLGLKIDTTQHKVRLNKLLWEIIWQIIFGGLFIGLLASLIISKIITSKIHSFIQQSTEVVNGNYQKKVNTDIIQEIQDLSNSFNTMSSVLDEILSNKQREFITSEQFRSMNELFDKYNEMTWKPIYFKQNTIDIAINYIGNHVQGELWDVFTHQKNIYIILAKLFINEYNLTSSLEASTALKILKSNLTSNRNISLALDDMHEYFNLHKMICIQINTETDQVTEFTQEKNHKMINKSYKLEQNQIYSQYIMKNNDIESIKKTYFSLHSQLNMESLLKEVEHCLRIDNQGVIVLYKKI